MRCKKMNYADEKMLNDLIGILPTHDAFELAALNGIRIRFARWHPVTAGELVHDRMEITINQNAPLSTEKVIAHELGHFMVKRDNIILDDEEKFCDAFAGKLIALRAATE